MGRIYDSVGRARRLLRLAVLWFLLDSLVSLQGATLTWINASGGNWSTAGNWSPAQVPGASDTANITASGTYAITINGNVQAAGLVLGAASGTQTLTVSGATLGLSGGTSIGANGVLTLNNATVTGAVTVNGTLNCNSSTVGPQSAITVLTGGTLNLGGTTSSGFYSELTNSGTVNWSATGDWYVYRSAVSGYTGAIVNEAGGVVDVRTDRSIVSQAGAPYISNAGIFQKSAGSNTTINLAFTNTGTLNISTGMVSLAGGGAVNGTVTGAGTLNASQGTLVVGGTIPKLDISGATVVGQSAQIDSLSWNGTLQGSNTVTGTASWTGGSLGTGGSVTIASNAVLNITGNSSVALYGLLLNAGTIRWSSVSGFIYAYNSASAGTTGAIVNQAGGLFDLQNDQSISSGSGAPYFSNAGLLRKSAGSNTVINLAFTNTGTVNLASGNLTLGSGGASSGNFTGSGNLNVSSGTVVLSGAVPNLIVSGATIAGQSASISKLTWSSGTLQGTNSITGSATWPGGTWGAGGVLKITPGAVVNIAGNSTESLYGTLDNSGTVNWSSTGAIYAYNSSSSGNTGGIINETSGVFNVQNDQSLASGSGSPFFLNAGLFEKTVGTNTTINLVFTNTGTMNLASGTLNLGAGGSVGGTISGSGSLNAGSGALALSGNPPNLVISGATLAAQNATIGNLDFNSGVLQGTSTLTGVANWMGGNVGGGGSFTVAPAGVLNINGNSSASLYGLLVNSGTVNWSSNSDIYVYNSASAGWNGGIVNQPGAVFNAENDRSINSGSGSPYFNNAGTFQKSAGTNTSINVGFTNAGTVSLSIYGRTACGRLNFPGNVVLAGALAVNFDQAYSPHAGDRYALLTYNSEAGSFSSVSVPTAGPWQTNLVNYGPASFNLTIGSSYRLGFSSGPPATNAAAVPLPLVIQIETADGAPLHTNGVPVTLTLSGGSGTLSGTTTQTSDASGKASFSDLSLNLVGQKTLTASSAAWITPVTTNLTIVPGQPSQLRLLKAITVSPQKNGFPIVPGPVVQVLDGPGNVVSNATVLVTAKASSAGGGGSLGGVTSATANGTNGAATFNNLSYLLKNPNTAETVSFYFTSPGLVPVTNDPVAVEFVCGLITLMSGNSTVQIDPTSDNGVYAWVVDGANQMSQQWFWLQSGASTTQVSLDQLGTPLGQSVTASAAAFHYLASGLTASLTFALEGGSPGSHVSTLTESVSIQNASNNTATWHFYEYADFDLAGSTEGDTIGFPGTNVVVQQGKGATANQIVGGPAASFWEASWYGLTLDALQSPGHALLSDKVDQPTPGDQTFAYQWDLSVAAGQSFGLNLTNGIQAQAQGLRIVLAGDNAFLLWSTNEAAGLKLQSTDDLLPASTWLDVSSVPQIVGSMYQATAPLTNRSKFFRLH